MKNLDRLLAAEKGAKSETHTSLHSVALTSAQKQFVRNASNILGKKAAATAIRKAMIAALAAAIDEKLSKNPIMEEKDDDLEYFPAE